MIAADHRPPDDPARLRRRRLVAAALVLLAALCFSAKAVLVKLAFRRGIDDVSLLTLRMSFSLPFFAALAAWSGRRGERAGPRMRLRDWSTVVALGLSGYYVASALDFKGLAYISAGLERLILFLYPTLVLALSAIFLETRVTRAQLSALALTYGGVALALLDRAQLAAGSDVPLGATLVFLSGLAYAIYLVGSGPFITRLGSLRYTSIAMIAAAVGSIVHHGLSRGWALFHYSGSVYAIAAIMALFSTVLPTIMMNEAVGIIGAGNVAIIGSVGPVATVALGYLVLDERFGAWQALGTALVILGVLRASLARPAAPRVQS